MTLTAMKARYPVRLAALLVLLSTGLHASSIVHPFLLDDGVQIFRNPAVTAGAPLAAYFLDRETTSSRPDYNTRIYRPMRNLAFRAIVTIAGVRPLAFGIANLLLYGAAVLLVLLLALRLTNDRAAAAWATLLWAMAPVHVEAVAYASALGDQLSLVLELAALAVALPMLGPGPNENRTRPAPLALSALLALAAMLAKEMAVTEPGVLALVAIAVGAWPWRAGAARVLVALHGAVLIGYLALRTHVLHAIGQAAITGAGLRAGLREAPWLLVQYLRLTVMPLGHAASYRVPPPTVWELLLALAILGGAVALAWRVKRPALTLGLGWFAISLVPVLHLVPLWADLADRFVLFPSVGLALTLAAGLVGPRVRKPLAIAVLSLATCAFAAGSVLEARAWWSNGLLWRYAVDRQPDAPLARANLAAMMMLEGDPAGAVVQLEALHALGYTRSDLELKLAWARERVGLHARAVEAAQAAIALDPELGPAHAFYGELRLADGDTATAQAQLVEARRLAAHHPSTGLLGFRLLGVGGTDPRVAYLRAIEALYFDDPSAATRSARECVRLQPDRHECEAVLGQALAKAGPLTAEARELLTRAIATLPDGPDRRGSQEALWGAR